MIISHWREVNQEDSRPEQPSENSSVTLSQPLLRFVCHP